MVFVCLAIIAVIAVIDLRVKWLVEKNVISGKDKKIAGECLILRKVHNRGLCMGILEKRPWLVKACSIIAFVIVLIGPFVMFGKSGYGKEKVGLSFIAGGAISNTYDRIKRGYVVDYIGINCKNKKISRITYNIGDFAIFAGGILVIISQMLSMKNS